jgi:hypothetical protein
VDITFQEFKNYVDRQLKTQKRLGLRNGQTLMNCLSTKRPDKYHEVIGSHVDCFYDDNKIKDTINYLERHWHD